MTTETMQDKTQSELTITVLNQGGYVVMTQGHQGYASVQHFATTSLDEALDFIKRKMK